MLDTARALLEMPSAAHALRGDFGDHERQRWNYTPVERFGLSLGEADGATAARIWQMVDAGLGERGRRQAREILELEAELHERSGGRPMRDPGRYYLGIFGRPPLDGPWGWSFEGHHLSLNFTLDQGRVIGTTPAFFGGNPAHVQEGARAGLRPFADEEENARALLLGLPAELRARAHIADSSPGNILTANDIVALRPPRDGVRYGEMSVEARAGLRELLGLYASRLAPELAESEMAAIEEAGWDEILFAWAGGLEPGVPHYYRILGPTFLIEYDASQDDGDHVHSVWRNFARDFGPDPLRAHLERDHGLRVHAASEPHTHGSGVDG